MGLSEIIGHQKQLETLRLGMAKGRLHHAYLFSGPEGVGKRTLAIALAKAIHCTEMSADFCDQCRNCARIQDGNHPDVRIIGPLAAKKEISIEQIREIEKQLNFRSFSGEKKIAILDPATLMNLAAQNALLKTLEEPPKDSLLVLLATSGGNLLPTLRSRCLRLSFGPLPKDLVAGFLVSKEGMKADEAEFLAAITAGSIGAAVKLDKAELLEKRRVWIGLLDSLNARNYRAAITAAEALAGNREETLRFLEWAQSWYRDLLVHAATQDSKNVINVDMLAQIQQKSTNRDVEHLLSSIFQSIRATARIQRNLNRRMVLESLFFQVVEAR